MSTLPFANPDASPRVVKRPRPVNLYLAGVGSVGTVLLDQIAQTEANAVQLRVIGACTSRAAAWSTDGASPADVQHGLDGTAPDWDQLIVRLEHGAPRPLIFIDATGSREVARYYDQLLTAGIHIVTPSKQANTQEQTYFDRLIQTAHAHDAHYRYETSVGAGLPVVQTVRDLVATGDRIRTIRGAVSGTLTFLFSEIRRGAAFSEAVEAAIERGYAEPDVRDDLSGEDVARKFTILARTAGFAVERPDVQVESLVPEELRDIPRAAFLNQLDRLNDYWRQRSNYARSNATALQYVGTLANGAINVGVQRLPPESPLGRLQGQDNLFEIYTDRYAESPLIVRGPGAGPDVTAAGVLADVLKVAHAVAGRPG